MEHLTMERHTPLNLFDVLVCDTPNGMFALQVISVGNKTLYSIMGVPTSTVLVYTFRNVYNGVYFEFSHHFVYAFCSEKFHLILTNNNDCVLYDDPRLHPYFSNERC